MGHVITHSYWRSCSTYLWSKAQSSAGCVAYYEPFHELLTGNVRCIEANSLDWNSRHPKISNYFAEITSAYKHHSIHEYPQRNGEWGSAEFFLYSDSQRRHIANLAHAFLESKEPNCYWSFNRGISKISSIHNSISALTGAMPISLLIHREPTQQLSSIMYQSANGNYWFEARPYAIWLAGQLVSGILPDEIGALGRFAQLAEENPASTLSFLPSRKELSAYLYSCTLLKSLMLSLREWPPELQSSFLRDNCFLVDAFTCVNERHKFTSRIAQGGISIELDDFALDTHKPFLCSDEMAIALSCALKNVKPELQLDASLCVVSDYFRRLSNIDSSYSSLMQTTLASAHPLTAVENDFMEHVKSQADDFVLLADNKRLRCEIASAKQDNQNLKEAQAELCIQIASLDDEKAECIKVIERRLETALEDRRQILIQLEERGREAESLRRVCDEQTHRIKCLEERIKSLARERELINEQRQNSFIPDSLRCKIERLRSIGNFVAD